MTQERSRARWHAPQIPHAAGFWLIAVSFLTLMSFTTVPTPLYPLYQQRDHFADSMITVIFAAYGVGVLAGLLLAGHISDQLGRRRMIVVSAVLSVIAALLFISSASVPMLLLARFINGFGIGTLTAAATAHLTELHDVGYPKRDNRFAATVATVVNTGGLALGPLVAGLLTEWLPHPLTLPFVIYAVALTIVTVAVLTVPETAQPAERWTYRPQRVRVDAAHRREFGTAALGALAAFSVFGVSTSLAATFTRAILDNPSRLVAGSIAFGVLGGSAVAQVLCVRMSVTQRLRLACGLMTVGLVMMAISAPTASLALFAGGGVAAGAGSGLVFQAAIQTAARLAVPEHRAETIAGMFVAAYIGITVPVVAVGIALTATGNPVAVLVVFSGLVLVTVLIAIAAMLRDVRRRA
ncbi:MFS transporter [Millisia brevis]|uniref:MFS transporter n=1 Tax=Millisia brevis TaxID=264148 RepID=UPI0014709D6A|nr:MFS transporter [Millisia brevis]